MPDPQQTFYRANDGIIAGVCSGLARYWGIDTGVLRFAFIALTVATVGAFALIYIALWLVLPSQEGVRRTVDVNPDYAASDIYGARESQEACKHKREKTRADYAHEPPQSPDMAATAAAARAREWSRQAPPQSPAPVAIGLGLGILLAVVGMAFAVSSFATVFTPLQFWPLGVVALGIVRMVVPAERGYRLEDFTLGFVLFCLGAVLLANTAGVFFVHFGTWLMQGWPILAMALGCLLLWRGTSFNGFAFCVMALMVAFCATGVMFCSNPGPAMETLIGMPFTRGLPMMVVQ